MAQVVVIGGGLFAIGGGFFGIGGGFFFGGFFFRVEAKSKTSAYCCLSMLELCPWWQTSRGGHKKQSTAIHCHSITFCLFIKGLGDPFVHHFGPQKYGISVLLYVLKGLEFPIRFGIILHEKVQDVINVDPRIFQIKFVALEVEFCPVI
jgi:hypothetical protein